VWRCRNPGTMTDIQFFPYRFDSRWSPLFRLLRVGVDDGVSIIDGDVLRATYGRSTIETPLVNIDHTLLTADHRWYTAVGKRLSFADDGITFGTNHHAGLCIEFIDKIPSVIGFKDHSSLWVSVEDPDGLAEALNRPTTAP
jgi:hypothetical protein